MALETGTYINELNPAWPIGSDGKERGDDHIRLMKSILQNTLPNATGALNATPTEFNRLVGLTTAILEVNDLQALPGAIGATTPVASTWTDVTVSSNLILTATNGSDLLDTNAPFLLGEASTIHLEGDARGFQVKNGATGVSTMNLQANGGTLDLGPQQGNGSVNLYNDGNRVAYSRNAGINVADGSGATPIIVMEEDDGTRSASFTSNGSGPLTILKETPGRGVVLEGRNAANTADVQLFAGDPDGESSLSHLGAIQALTWERGLLLRGDSSNDPTAGAGSGARLGFHTTAGLVDGAVGFPAGPSADLQLSNTVHGGSISLLAENNAGTPLSLFSGLSEGDTDILGVVDLDLTAGTNIDLVALAGNINLIPSVGTVTGSYAGAQRMELISEGMEIRGALNNSPTTGQLDQDTRINLANSGGTLVGVLGFGAGGGDAEQLIIRSENEASNVMIQGRDFSNNLRTMLQASPTGATVLGGETGISFRTDWSAGTGPFTGIEIGTSGSGAQVGFFGQPPISQPTVVGSAGGNAALINLLGVLTSLGLIINSTTP